MTGKYWLESNERRRLKFTVSEETKLEKSVISHKIRNWAGPYEKIWICKLLPKKAHAWSFLWELDFFINGSNITYFQQGPTDADIINEHPYTRDLTCSSQCFAHAGKKVVMTGTEITLCQWVIHLVFHG